MKKIKLIICLYLLICCGSILASDLVFADSLDLQYDPTEGEVMREWLLATSSESDLDLTLANPGDKALVEQTVNGYTVRIINLKRSIERKFGYSENGATDVQVISVDVCYTTPDSIEWLLDGPPDMLRTDSIASQGWEEKFNYWDEKKADGKEIGEKCVRYMFNFDLETKIDPPITIEFSELKVSTSGGYYPCREMKERFETNPRAREAGITIHCTDIPTGVPDGMEPLAIASVHLDGYDESRLTKQEAHRLMLEIESGVIYGPWVFTIDSLNTDEFQP